MKTFFRIHNNQEYIIQEKYHSLLGHQLIPCYIYFSQTITWLMLCEVLVERIDSYWQTLDAHLLNEWITCIMQGVHKDLVCLANSNKSSDK